MTIEEKRNAISKYCTGKRCDDCPLNDMLNFGETCYSASANIERNYDVLFGNKGDVETTNVVDETVYETVDEVVTEPTKIGLQDMVNHPGHYESGKFECIDVMIETQGVEAVMNFCICNAFKYLYRHNRKNGLEDIKKAIWYLNKYVELEESKCTDTPTEDK